MDFNPYGSNNNHHHHQHQHHHHQQQKLALSLGNSLSLENSQMLHSYNVNPTYLIPGGTMQFEEKDNSFLDDEDDDTYNSFANPSSSSSYRSSNRVFLKTVQAVLEEVVGLGGREAEASNEDLVHKFFNGSKRLCCEVKAELSTVGLLPIMSSPDKHQLHIQLAKLVSLLEEVEGRFEKYYNQLQQVVSSFESIAGEGSSKPYTNLALQAMTKHFINLRDSIVHQINLIRRKISHTKINTGLSRLSLFDTKNNTTRHHDKGLVVSIHQQLGLLQNQRQTWRPIRGLPENSVAVLRSWLFEHFLHPYPKESEKLTLASQTGLTKNQVSNWFINARVRLWKPMIEEIYKEEFGESSDDSNPSKE